MAVLQRELGSVHRECLGHITQCDHYLIHFEPSRSVPRQGYVSNHLFRSVLLCSHL